MSAFSPVQSPLIRTSLADMVYQQLLEGILAGSLPSGSHLNLADIAGQLQVSPSPVREALLRLATEGLVTNNTNRRATVVSFSERAIVETFEVREILESGAARLAAARIDAATLDELKDVMERADALSHKAPPQKKDTLDLDNRFHLIIADASGNKTLKEEVLAISRRVRVMQLLGLNPLRLSQAYNEHREVLRALKRHDPAASYEAMSRHVKLSLQYVLENISGTS